ncbi:DUF469 family protein [Opitutaceae bacterium TAV4]|nr:DUF469 family protein [Opitutaceae bacterium TAV4]RRK00151.1 DUF469 family protein [Opitutaceae bacterium TAV3]
MKKRLRKKKHLGEFRQFGFELTCRFQTDVPVERFDRFVDEFIADAIEADGLTFGGGGDLKRGWSGVVSRDHRYASITEEDREHVHGWLLGQEIVAAVELSEPCDLWHGSGPLEKSALPEATHRAGQPDPTAA